MKYKCLILVIATILSHYVNGMAKNLDGTYSDEYGVLMMDILEDILYMRSYDGDVLAVCSVKEVSDDFLEINSISEPTFYLMENMTTQYSKQSEEITEPHPIVRFILPNTRHEMEFNIFCNETTYSGTSHNRICEISLDRQTLGENRTFSFLIAPTHYCESNVLAQYFGVLYIWYPIENQYENDDIISIELPAVTNTFFEQFFITGEYIQLVDEGLKWKGRTYYKK